MAAWAVNRPDGARRQIRTPFADGGPIMFRTPACAVALIAFALLVATPAFAELLGHEDFGGYRSAADHEALKGRIVPNGQGDNPVGGQNAPATAKTGIANWQAKNPWVLNQVLSGDLTYPSLARSGDKHLLCNAGGMDVWAAFDTSDAGVFSDHLVAVDGGKAIGKPGSRLCLSYLFKLGGTDTSAQNHVQLRQGETTRFLLGHQWGRDVIRVQNRDLGPLDTDTHLVVVCITFRDGPDEAKIWYDPKPGVAEAEQEPAATLTGEMTFDNLYIRSQNNGGIAIDELRIGTSFTDVTPTK
jgi:hypothetical protein